MIHSILKKNLIVVIISLIISAGIFAVFSANSFAMTEQEARLQAERQKEAEVAAKAEQYRQEALAKEWEDSLENMTWEKFYKDPVKYLNAVGGSVDGVLKGTTKTGERYDFTGILSYSKWGKKLLGADATVFTEVINAANEYLHKPVTWIYMADGFHIPFLKKFLKIEQDDMNISQVIYNIFVPLAVILALLYCLLDILNLITNRIRELDIKAILLSLFKFALCLVMIKFMPTIMSALLEVGNSLIIGLLDGEIAGTKISFNASEGMDPKLKVAYYAVVCAIIDDMNIMECLGLIALAPLVFLTSIVPQVILLFQAMSRKVEIILRVGFAPVACADIYNGISNSKALSYLKKLAVCIMYGFIMVCVIKVCYALQQNDAKDMILSMQTIQNASNAQGKSQMGGAAVLPGFVQVIESLIYSFVAVGLVSSSKQIMSDAIGA